jgi:NitT/TauT family transport system permease protein
VSRRRERRAAVLATQVALGLVILAGWQFVPQIHGIQHWGHVFDPFFISSPQRIAQSIRDLATGASGGKSLWSYLSPTLFASLLGALIGMVLGAMVGLLLSNIDFLSRVLQPYLVALNAVPRVALIPIMIILFGPTFTASVVMAVLVTFFVAFFNAYEGGRNVPPQLLQNARVLGANGAQIMLRVRLPYVLAWTLAALPLAVTFAILTVVTSEILSGNAGMGQLLYNANVAANSSQTFAVVVILSVVGVLVVSLAQVVKRRVLHWWTES